MAVTNAVSWRSEGIKYRKNEVFLDVIESVNLLVNLKILFKKIKNLKANANGTVLRSEIVGSIRMRVILSGMPELRLGLNDKVLFQAVRSLFKLKIFFKLIFVFRRSWQSSRIRRC